MKPRPHRNKLLEKYAFLMGGIVLLFIFLIQLAVLEDRKMDQKYQELVLRGKHLQGKIANITSHPIELPGHPGIIIGFRFYVDMEFQDEHLQEHLIREIWSDDDREVGNYEEGDSISLFYLERENLAASVKDSRVEFILQR